MQTDSNSNKRLPVPKSEKAKKLHLIKHDNQDVNFNDFAPKLFERFFKFGKKIECVVWTFPNNQEVGFWRKEVPLDAQEFELNGKYYSIDHNKIQNRLGKLVYNTQVNDVTGGLAFRKENKKSINAKNAKETLQRNWLTALWGKWKMPFLIMLVLGIATLALVIVLFIVAIQWKDASSLAERRLIALDGANACLTNAECLASNLSKLGYDVELGETDPDDPDPIGGNN